MAYNTASTPTLAELITRKFIPEKFSKDVLMHTMSNLVVANAFTHRYKKDLRNGYKVSIPVMSEISTSEVTPGSEPSASDAAGTAASITVDKWFEATVEISPLMDVEVEADYMANAAKAAAYAINKKIDTTVGALFSALNSTPGVYGSDGQTFTDAVFRALVEQSDQDDVPDEGRFLIGDPSTKSDMLNIDKFVRNDFIGGQPTSNGKFGTLYNTQILITNNLTAATKGNYGVFAHPDAIGVVLQKNPRARVYDLGWKFITKIIVDSAWGADEIRDLFGVPFYTRKS